MHQLKCEQEDNLVQVSEMYGFLLGSYKAGLLPYDLRRDYMCEPPFDNGLPYYATACHILHYTFPMVNPRDHHRNKSSPDHCSPGQQEGILSQPSIYY